jgi:hypothetical protein
MHYSIFELRLSQLLTKRTGDAFKVPPSEVKIAVLCDITTTSTPRKFVAMVTATGWQNMGHSLQQ